MRRLTINELQINGILNLDTAEQLLENSADLQEIGSVNWLITPYKPEVRFRIAYCQNNIFLKFYVKEESIKASIPTVNGEVYKDSCVEFFIATSEDKPYYNFEFNCIGIPSASYGHFREDREFINEEILKTIKVKSSLGNQVFAEKTGGHYWELMIIIPKQCLCHNKNLNLKSINARANFHKCGDETIQPHFVTWNPIKTETPDFHQPEYFGILSFN